MAEIILFPKPPDYDPGAWVRAEPAQIIILPIVRIERLPEKPALARRARRLAALLASDALPPWGDRTDG